MSHFPDDNAHCEGANCDKRDRCLRHVALMQKSKIGQSNRIVMFGPDPKDCEHFIEAKS